MKFSDVQNVSDMIEYCTKNKKWNVILPPSNPLEVEVVFVYHETPLLIANSAGEIYYMSNYTKKDFITVTTAWYLSQCRRKFQAMNRVEFIKVIDKLNIERGML